jgi:nucleoid-associated protein YgaU
MGRETKILLTLLGLLVGVFMGVVALKLFVPRPPEGTGPDIDIAGEPLPLVDPPSLSAGSKAPAVVNADQYAGRSSRFGSPAPPSMEEPPRELAVVPVSYEHAVEAPASIDDPSFAEPLAPPSFSAEPLMEAPIQASPAAFAVAPAQNGPVPGETYVTRDGDSWWSLAEAAYGDGRLYRALYAWNRSLNERVSLVPGTTLDIPHEAKLGAAWSLLLPTD